MLAAAQTEALVETRGLGSHFVFDLLEEALQPEQEEQGIRAND